MTTSDLNKVLAAIDAQNRAFEKHFLSHDAKGLVEGYFVSDELDPMACPPGGSPPVKGRSALIAMFSGQFTVFDRIQLEAVSVVPSLTQAFELGRAHLTLRDGGKTTGRYTILWVSTNEGWRAKIDFFAQDGWQD